MPGFDHLGMVAPEIVQDHIDLLVARIDNPLQEVKETLGIDRFVIKREHTLARICDGADHIDPKLSGRML